MAKCTCGNSRYEIQVVLAGIIGEDAAVSGGEGDGISAVRFVDARFEEVGCGRRVEFGGWDE